MEYSPLLHPKKNGGYSPARFTGRVLFIFMLALLLSVSSALSEKEFRPLPLDLSPGAPVDMARPASLMEYEDPTIRVVRTAKTENEASRVTYYSAEIWIKDPSQLRTAPADPATFISQRVTYADALSRRVNAVYALNGDYCAAFQGNASIKYVLRQGTVYRETVDTALDMLLIDEDGNFHIIPGSPELETMDKTHIDGKLVFNAFQFGPGLVVDGKPVEDEYILDDNHSPQFAIPSGGARRICLIQLEPLHYMVVCSCYYANLAQFKQLVLSVAPDCQNAYVLDGGGSAQLIFMGRVANNVNKNSRRKLSDIVYFASAWFDK